MKTFKKILLASALVGPALIAAGSAQAQIGGIAVAEPETAILSAKALGAANASIDTTFKTQLDQSRARQQSLQAELATILGPLDTDHDKQVSDKELAAAEAAKSPLIEKAKTAQQTAQAEIQRLNAPPVRAQAYAIEQIALKYSAAVNTVVTAKKISLLLSAGNVQYAQPSVDVTDDITAELDRVLPTVSITAPAGWQPAQQTVQLQQQLQQLMYAQAVQRAQAQQGAAPGAPGAPAAPAGSPKKPSGR